MHPYVQNQCSSTEESLGDKIFRKIVRTCGQPLIKNTLQNLTFDLGDTARFWCSVDMKCMVSYNQWFHQMDNGTIRLWEQEQREEIHIRYLWGLWLRKNVEFYHCVAGDTTSPSPSLSPLILSLCCWKNSCRNCSSAYSGINESLTLVTNNSTGCHFNTFEMGKR